MQLKSYPALNHLFIAGIRTVFARRIQAARPRRRGSRSRYRRLDHAITRSVAYAARPSDSDPGCRRAGSQLARNPVENSAAIAARQGSARRTAARRRAATTATGPAPIAATRPTATPMPTTARLPFQHRSRDVAAPARQAPRECRARACAARPDTTSRRSCRRARAAAPSPRTRRASTSTTARSVMLCASRSSIVRTVEDRQLGIHLLRTMPRTAAASGGRIARGLQHDGESPTAGIRAAASRRQDASAARGRNASRRATKPTTVIHGAFSLLRTRLPTGLSPVRPERLRECFVDDDRAFFGRGLRGRPAR